MTHKVSTTAYAVLKPTKRYGVLNPETGLRPAQNITVTRMTKSRPTTAGDELAVKLNITLDASLFDKISPIVDIELEEGDVFATVNSQVTVEPEQEA